MECSFNLEVIEPGPNDEPFEPFVRFRFEQLNISPNLMNDIEIDFQIRSLIDKAKKLKLEAKSKLKAAKERHYKEIREKREEIS